MVDFDISTHKYNKFAHKQSTAQNSIMSLSVSFSIFWKGNHILCAAVMMKPGCNTSLCGSCHRTNQTRLRMLFILLSSLGFWLVHLFFIVIIFLLCRWDAKIRKSDWHYSLITFLESKFIILLPLNKLCPEKPQLEVSKGKKFSQDAWKAWLTLPSKGLLGMGGAVAHIQAAPQSIRGKEPHQYLR